MTKLFFNSKNRVPSLYHSFLHNSIVENSFEQRFLLLPPLTIVRRSSGGTEGKRSSSKDTIMFPFKNAFKDNIRHEPMVSLGNSFELLRLAKSLGWRVISACTDKRVSLFRELKILYGFCGYLLMMRKHHGATYAVKYLKSCHLAVQKCISKDKIRTLRELEPNLPLPRLTTSRLPRFIPLADRRAILSGNTFRIRY